MIEYSSFGMVVGAEAYSSRRDREACGAPVRGQAFDAVWVNHQVPVECRAPPAVQLGAHVVSEETDEVTASELRADGGTRSGTILRPSALLHFVSATGVSFSPPFFFQDFRA